MTSEDALARIAAQASREERAEAADVVLDNSGGIAGIRAKVDSLWDERLVPFARNLETGVRAARNDGPILVTHNPDWASQAKRLGERLMHAAPGKLLAVDHIGSTSVSGLDAQDVIDLQLSVADLPTADRIAPLLAAAGFPRVPGIQVDTSKASEPDAAKWEKRFHANADPGRPVNLHVRAAGSPGWRFALCFRDWLRANREATRAYLEEKRRLAALYAGDTSTAGYAGAKEGWFTLVAEPAMEDWARRSGWSPPSY